MRSYQPYFGIYAAGITKNQEGGKRMKNFRTWFCAAGIRALKTVAQTAIATIGTTAMLGEVNWIAVLSTAALSGLLSLLTSVAGLPELKE